MYLSDHPRRATTSATVKCWPYTRFHPNICKEMDAESSSGSEQGHLSQPSGLDQRVHRKAKKAPDPLRKQIAKRQLSGKELTASSPATTATADKGRRQPERWRKMVQHVALNLEVFDCAVDILTRLSSESDRRLASRVPHLYFQNRDSRLFSIRDPHYTLLKFMDNVHPPCSPPLLHHHHVCQVRQALIKDISILCRLRVVWKLDLYKLRIGYLNKPKPMYLPFLESFDFETSNTAQNWEQSEWEGFEMNAVQNVTKHFDVIEVIVVQHLAPYQTTTNASRNVV